MPELKKEALCYASLGLRVFPLQEKGKKPIPKSHGVKDATTDAEQVSAWWDRLPSANIGIATGNGLLVIDLDRKVDIDGVQSLLNWEKGSGYFYWSYKLLTDTVNTPGWIGWDSWDLGRSVDFGWITME